MKKPRQVAVILDATSPYQRKIIRGIAAYARQAGPWRLYVEEDPLEKLPDLRSWQGHGIITAFTERRFASLVHGLDLPVIGVEGGYGWYEPKSGIPYVTTDDETVARLAADHLLGQGFSRLAYCGLRKNRHTAWSARRAEAFRTRAREAGASCRIYTGRHLSTRRWAALQQDLCRWLASLDKPVGILAGNDARARHVLEACRTIGARVPEDVAVIGVDNHELLCELTDPPLSSIEQGARAAGFLAAVSVSRSTLEARFRGILGRTIHDEIQRTMVARARQLIAEEDIPLKEVASKAGFAHVQHLSNLFRRHLGRTPGEFRRLSRSS